MPLIPTATLCYILTTRDTATFLTIIKLFYGLISSGWLKFRVLTCLPRNGYSLPPEQKQTEEFCYNDAGLQNSNLHACHGIPR